MARKLTLGARTQFFTPLSSVGLLLLVALVLILSVVLLSYNQRARQTAGQPEKPISSSFSPIPTNTLTPSPDPTANWETYTNAKDGFSFRYPPEATLSPRTTDPFPVAISVQYDDPEPKHRGGGLYPTGWLMIFSETMPNPRGLSLRQWAEEKQFTAALPELGFDEPLVSDTTLGGREAITWNNDQSPPQTYYLVKRSTGLTFIAVNIVSPFMTKHQSTINQILSTFIFLEE